jgi:hypothetical protein
MELSLLCDEFGADKLRVSFDRVVLPANDLDFGFEARAFESEDKVAKLAKEVGLLERNCARTARLDEECGKLRGEIEALKESTKAEIEKLKSEAAKVANSVTGLQQDVERVESNSAELDKAFRTWVPKSLSVPMKEAEPATEADPLWDWKRPNHGTWVPKSLSFPMKGAKLLDGIISYLTKKHSGNVQEKGIVRITSKSVSDNPKWVLKNVADLTSNSCFWSKDEPGQWVCWDFGEMRVRPTRYTINGEDLKSWVVEGGLQMEVVRVGESRDRRI